MSIYNIAVLCLITAPVAMVIASQQDASFVFVALAVIFCCFLSMLLIFVPKVSSSNPECHPLSAQWPKIIFLIGNPIMKQTIIIYLLIEKQQQQQFSLLFAHQHTNTHTHSWSNKQLSMPIIITR